MNEKEYNVVYAINVHEDDFQIKGIFSKEADAVEFIVELERADGIVPSTVCEQKLPMAKILETLAKDRLGAMAKILMPLEEKMRALTKDL